MKSIAKRLLGRFGYDIVRNRLSAELTDEEREICAAVAPFTMTSAERILALIHATRYVIENDIKGDIVECGVWRGGSMMVVAYMLQRLGDTARKLYLYDTFQGMPAPSEKDAKYDGVPADQLLNANTQTGRVWSYADKRDVIANLRSTGYPEDNIFLVEGKVEDTIPQTLPDNIALLRLDTDWFESTKHELTHLYPQLTKHGVLIIDDYGFWQGAREATDEYFGQSQVKPFLHRIDFSARLVIKLDL